MKFLRRLCYFLMALMIALCALITLCALRPDLTEAIGNLVDPDRKRVEVSADSPIQAGTPPGGGEVHSWEREPENDTPGGGELYPENSGQSVAGTTGTKGEAYETGQGAGYAQAGEEGLVSDISPEYVTPDEADVLIPDKVSGKNGYQKIEDEGGEIGDEAADQLLAQISQGNTGDGLVFDPVYYPYYAMLDEKGKHMYRQIYANANDLFQAFAPVEDVTAPQLRTIFAAVYNDHPELFWLETAYYGKYRRNGQCVEIDLRFNRTAQNLEGEKAVFLAQADGILAQAGTLGSNYEKERFIHDTLIDRISYNMGAEMNQSAYSALVNGQTVCAGYARAFQYLLQQLGIPCYYCTGYAGESHAWNIVSLEDGFYNVDATWDDTEGGRYDYFNKTDGDFADTHIRQELAVYLPPCNGQMYRNQEQSAEKLRNLGDVGLTENDIVYSLSGYYTNCGSQITAAGSGAYEFYTVADGGALMQEIYQAYQSDDYKQGYMENAMTAIGASVCEMNLDVEELAGDRYLIVHKVNLR